MNPNTLSNESIQRPFQSLTVKTALFIIVTLLLSTGCTTLAQMNPLQKKIPVIFDTDICDDIDDTWALALLLQCPELDVKLITTEVGNTTAKSRTIAKFLEAAGRTDIPVGIGVQQHQGTHRQDAWAKNYDLDSYPGKIYKDGVQALIDTIMNSKKPITLIAVGPVPNIAAALEREPAIANKARFVGMHGSVYKGYGGSSEPEPEYNVKAYVPEAQKVFTAEWPMTITPLDTCGIIHLTGNKYQKVLNRNSAITNALMQNYRAWHKQGLINDHRDWSTEQIKKELDGKTNSNSTTLFDTVAVYLAITKDLARMEKLKIKVTDDGFTRVDETGKEIDCAVEWKDLGAYEDWLVDRLMK